MRRDCSAGRREFEPVIRLASASKIKYGALLRRLGHVTSAQCCFDVREHRRQIYVELPRNVLDSRRKIAERSIILVEKLVIEALADNFTRPLFDFTDVNQHPCRWIHGTGEDEVGDVIATAPVTRVRFRAESAQVFSITPIANVQTPGGGEFQALADCQKHNVITASANKRPNGIWHELELVKHSFDLLGILMIV